MSLLKTWFKFGTMFKKIQKANALSKLQNYTKITKKDSDIYFFLKVQSLVIYAYFDEYEEIISLYEELKQKLDIVPSRFYTSIAKVIHDKIDTEMAKVFLNKKLPKNLDLELTIDSLKKMKLMNYQVFYQMFFMNVVI